MISTIVLVFVAAAVIAAAALAILGVRRPSAPAEGESDQRPLPLFDSQGSITAATLASVRFEVVPRGYRMAEVDAVITALVEQLAQPGEHTGAPQSHSEGGSAAAVASAQGGDSAERPSDSSMREDQA